MSQDFSDKKNMNSVWTRLSRLRVGLAGNGNKLFGLKYTSLCIRLKFMHRTMATIHATPTATLVDEMVTITLSGLDPGSRVTVRSYLPDSDMRFEAHGHYMVDNHGDVCVTETPSVGGTFTGIEPMGLFWSMIQCPGQKIGLRYVKKDVTMPMEITLSAHTGHIDMGALQADIPIAKTKIHRTYLGPDVEIIKVHSGRIRGHVFKPKDPGPFQGVIDLFGSAGGLMDFRAALLASRGFVAYALPFYRYEDLPTNMNDLDLDYFEEATDWLQQQSYVRPGGIGVVAVSWGAQVAALMATNFPEKVVACVCISGPCLRVWSPISYKGEQFPYLEFDLAKIRVVQAENPQILNIFDMQEPFETAPVEAIIELEKAHHLLFFVGMDDRNWNSPEHMDAAERRLRALGCNNYEVVRYPKAGHLIEPPFAPLTLNSYYPWLSAVIEWGGSPREHQRAQEDHWTRLLKFLKTYIGNHKKHIQSRL